VSEAALHCDRRDAVARKFPTRDTLQAPAPVSVEKRGETCRKKLAFGPLDRGRIVDSKVVGRSDTGIRDCRCTPVPT